MAASKRCSLSLFSLCLFVCHLAQQHNISTAHSSQLKISTLLLNFVFPLPCTIQLSVSQWQKCSNFSDCVCFAFWFVDFFFFFTCSQFPSFFSFQFFPRHSWSWRRQTVPPVQCSRRRSRSTSAWARCCILLRQRSTPLSNTSRRWSSLMLGEEEMLRRRRRRREQWRRQIIMAAINTMTAVPTTEAMATTLTHWRYASKCREAGNGECQMKERKGNEQQPR